MNLPSHVSESVKRLNPQVYGAPLVAMESSKRKSGAETALDHQPQARKRSSGRASVVVSLIALRRRELDDDNLVAGFKPLRDAIALKLGIDDADKRVKWQYGQQRTDGEQGTVVMIEWIS